MRQREQNDDERTSLGVFRPAALLHPLDASWRSDLRHCKPVCDALYDHHKRGLLFELKAGGSLYERFLYADRRL